MLSNELLHKNKSDFSMRHDLIIHPLNMKTPHYHNHYEITYSCKSRRKYYINDQLYILNDSQIALIPPALLHRSESPEDIFQERFLINFNHCFIEKIVDALGIDLFACFDSSAPIKICTQSQISSIIEIMNNLLIAQNQNNTPMLQLLLCQLLLQASHFSPASPADVNDKTNIMSDIIKYIDQNYNNEITLDSLSKTFSVDKYQLSRNFSKYTNMTFVKYLNKTRIENAEFLLKNTRLSVSEIAQEAGYNNVQHFSYIFKKTRGISPNTFRKINKGNA